MCKLLLIDDDVKYQQIIKELLNLEGYEVDCVSDPVIGIDMFKSNTYDLIITDLLMDTIDGLQLVSIIKRLNKEIPIIILTGYEDTQKEVEGFDLEVDDYIYKPVSMEVLLKRIDRRLKARKVNNKFEELNSASDDIRVVLKERKVYQNGKRINLTVKEFELLSFFLSNKNTIFTREEILESVWRTNKDIVDVRTIDTHIKKIRGKMAINSINSIRGVGYEWFE
ncbi:response regulator transcription factor [Erysipelotrichaceae bacterium OttesenSCG-928-M19]|nr:response regulator transcription factor [Erysipelotrichaceae bacterium OttesenSCG-928-M19]